MSGVELGLQLAGAELVFVLEELHGGGGARALLLLVLLEPGAQGEGATGVQVECDGDTVVTRSHNGPSDTQGGDNIRCKCDVSTCQ